MIIKIKKKINYNNNQNNNNNNNKYNNKNNNNNNNNSNKLKIAKIAQRCNLWKKIKTLMRLQKKEKILWN